MSSRANKAKFCEGERVLCYEPDPTKAKVLYDSKVLDIVISKDSKGKKVVEYLIHFQGWNSSWDRCVSEESVLKDSPENRQLQRDLAERSQLHFGVYLYRKERKKQSRKVSEPRTSSTQLKMSEETSSVSPAKTVDVEEPTIPVISSEPEPIVEEEIISIELNDYLRSALELDYHLINNKNKLMKLPAIPHIVAILESYWRHYCSSLLCDLNGNSNRRLNRPILKVKPEDLQRNLNICKEMLDGLRIYFDFTLSDLLLYKREMGGVDVQYAKNKPPIWLSIKKEDDNMSRSKGSEFTSTTSFTLNEVLHACENNTQRVRKRSLRSNRAADTLDTNGILPDEPSAIRTREIKQNISVVNSGIITEGMDKMFSWRLLPDYVYFQHPRPPSLVYGATHLLRLFVKLPELLNASGMMEKKLKVLHQHLENFLNYLTDHKEWFGDRYYTD